MRFLPSESLDPTVNLAQEEALLRSDAPGDVFRIWRDAPSVILGCNQVLGEEVDVAAMEAEGLRAYRRCTGGGAVYHDEGVVNFTFATSVATPVGELLRLLLDAIGMGGFVTERNDVLLGGRKIIGTAQAVHGRRRLFHGSILYDADLGRLARVLTPPPAKLVRHGVASVAARVANLRPFLPDSPPTPVFMGRLETRLLHAVSGDG